MHYINQWLWINRKPPAGRRQIRWTLFKLTTTKFNIENTFSTSVPVPQYEPINNKCASCFPELRRISEKAFNFGHKTVYCVAIPNYCNCARTVDQFQFDIIRVFVQNRRSLGSSEKFLMPTYENDKKTPEPIMALGRKQMRSRRMYIFV